MSRPRKILQIAAAADEASASIFALCEEGRIWCKMFNSAEHPWREIDPLPPIEDVATKPASPVPVGERPWEREGWCHPETGECWIERYDREFPQNIRWELGLPPTPQDIYLRSECYAYGRLLPHDAIPILTRWIES